MNIKKKIRNLIPTIGFIIFTYGLCVFALGDFIGRSGMISAGTILAITGFGIFIVFNE